MLVAQQKHSLTEGLLLDYQSRFHWWLYYRAIACYLKEMGHWLQNHCHYRLSLSWQLSLFSCLFAIVVFWLSPFLRRSLAGKDCKTRCQPKISILDKKDHSFSLSDSLGPYSQSLVVFTMVLVKKRQRMEASIFGQPLHTVMQITACIHGNQSLKFRGVGFCVNLQQCNIYFLQSKNDIDNLEDVHVGCRVPRRSTHHEFHALWTETFVDNIRMGLKLIQRSCQ